MDSFPQQQQKPKSSVFSLLNPINEEPSASYSSQNFSKRTFENPALQSNRNEASNTNEKRKRVRMFGLELDVPYNENPKELLITAHDQLELFTNNLYHAQTQEYQHQEELQKGVIQTPTVEHNNNNNNKSTPYTDSERTEEYQRLISYMEYMFQHQYNPSLSSYNQVQPPAFIMPTTISPTASTQPNPCSLPSILNPPLTLHTTTYSQLDSQAFLSQRIKQSPAQVTAEQIEPTATTSPSSPYTATSHKYRTVLIQPSSQDPPIEARLIVDDPKTNPFTQQWLEHFQELKAFKEQFGHTNVTRSITGYYNLGNWVAEQRRKFKQGKVTESQFNCLNQIGFEWDRSYYFFRTRHKKRNSMGSEKESPRTE